MGVRANQLLARARTEGPLTAAFFVVGIALIAAGVAMVYLPAGVIVAGCLTVLSVFLYLAGVSR